MGDLLLEREAVISECQRYRYLLRRAWDHRRPRALLVMLNPSTADAEIDDATIRSCIRLLTGFVGSFEVVNLFAFRATNPAELSRAADPIGPRNDDVIEAAVCRCDIGICDDQVALAEAHASPLLARAVTLAANTGQRGSDLIRMGWGDLEDYKGITGINVRQVKTGRGLWIPVTPELAAAMVAWERRPGPFLVGTRGAFSRGSLTKRWERERDTVPELAPLRDVAPGATHPHLVLHGLRATCVVRLRRAGISIPQICDIVGMSPAMVERYCRFADQRDNAIATVHVLGERKRRVE